MTGGLACLRERRTGRGNLNFFSELREMTLIFARDAGNTPAVITGARKGFEDHNFNVLLVESYFP